MPKVGLTEKWKKAEKGNEFSFFSLEKIFGFRKGVDFLENLGG